MTRAKQNILYLRFSLMNLTLLGTIALLVANSAWAVLGIAGSLLLESVLDERLGDSKRNFSRAQARYLDAMLYLTLPLLAVLALCHITVLSGGDPFGVGWLVRALTGFDMLAARDATAYGWRLAASLPVGMLFGIAGINVAHELFHRLQSPLAVATGRWLLSFTADTTFAIEHVHGHHRNVGTPADPATARRGESFYRFVVRSTCGEIANGFRLEANRLRNRGLPVIGHHNRALRGQLMTLLVAALYIYGAGAIGLAAFLAAAALGKAYLETTNYVEHYGLVRAPGQRVEARHSWDSYRIVTGSLLYNLPRHSDHHLNAGKAFWQLQAQPQAPQLPHGYQTMIFLALIPPAYLSKMAPLLKQWDQTQASPEEQRLILGARGF